MRIKPRSIIETVKECCGDLTRASNLLGIHRTTIWRWIKRARTNSQSRIGYLSSRGLERKSTPNENAVIERTFRTDEEEFFFMMERAPKDYDELRDWFAAWLYEYNYERPHLGIDLKTPYEVVANLMLD